MSTRILMLTAMSMCMAFAAPAMAGDAMMKKDGMAMEKSMNHDDMMMKQQVAFSQKEFAAAKASGEPFLIAFHKDGCSVCAKQQKALNSIYADPAHSKLKVLAVDYDRDTESLKKFNVGQQSVLILYKGDKEISRTEGLTGKKEILAQLNTKDAMMMDKMDKDDGMIMKKDDAMMKKDDRMMNQ